MKVFFRIDKRNKNAMYTEYNCGFNLSNKNYANSIEWEGPAVKWLKKTFKSVKVRKQKIKSYYSDRVSTSYIFHFEDDADDAYFLLLSINGITV